jgi:hypothetical protein
MQNKIREIRALLANTALLSTKLDTPTLDKQAVMVHIQAVDNHLKLASPDVMCGYCSGQGCRACKETGWMSKEFAAMQPKEFHAS